MVRPFLSILTAFSLLMAPGLARASNGLSKADVLESMKTDDLDRPFPNPEILQRARIQAGLGAGLTVGGAVLMFTGMMVGSAASRGELTLPPSPFPSLIESDRIDESAKSGFAFIGISAGSGILMMFLGVPLLSVGVFTTKQMLRTIKGAEKVPRTVANEKIYWRGLTTQHFGQAIGIAGGAFVAFGVIALVGQGATVDTQVYREWGWAIGPAVLGAGVGILVLGIKMTQKGRQTQEDTWDAVDPRRQKGAFFSPGIPVPVVARRGQETWGGVAWSFSF